MPCPAAVPTSTCRLRRAFSLVELMIVVVVMAILVAMLLPALNQAWAVADLTTCTDNLHRISQALGLRASDEMLRVRLPDMKPTWWCSQLLPYLENRADFYICPAGGRSETEGAAYSDSGSGDSGSGDSGDWQSTASLAATDAPVSSVNEAELAEVKVVAGSTIYTIALAENEYCIKFSIEQYEAARSQGLLGDADSANQLRTKFDCTYRAGANPNSYWLCFEDHGGDWDFKDVMILVSKLDDGTLLLYIWSGATGHTNSLISKPDGVTLAAVPAHTNGIQIALKNPDEMDGSGGSSGSGGGSDGSGGSGSSNSATVISTSYAMNYSASRLTRTGGKIILLDYSNYIARSIDLWADVRLDPNRDGTPKFARHSGRINVLFSDGSVRLTAPAEINPALPTLASRYWEP